MKALRFIAILLLSTAVFSSSYAQKLGKNEALVVFKVGIDCEGCKKKIEKNISFEKGVKDLKVNLEEKLVTIVYDKTKTTTEDLQKAIEKLNYKVEIQPAKE